MMNGREYVLRSIRTTSNCRLVPVDEERYHPQSQCWLFKLPSELRSLIWEYVLAEYQDMSRPFPQDTTCCRLEYLAPRRIDTALLRTCQQIYRETWWLPWAKTLHTFFLESKYRLNTSIMPRGSTKKVLKSLGNIEHENIKIEHARIFAHLVMLEIDTELGVVLAYKNFSPTRITITIRHTDWLYWQRDDELSIRGGFTDICRFPNSVQRLCIELETMERRKEEADFIADEMRKKWRFIRFDGTRLIAPPNEPNTITRWTGHSIWEERRWMKAESRPLEIDYYIAAVTFKPISSQRASHDGAHQTILLDKNYHAPDLRATSISCYGSLGEVLLKTLNEANIPINTPPPEVIERLADDEYNRTIESLLRKRLG